MKPGALCIVSYPFRYGTGPWNYMLEEPPESAQEVRDVCIFVGETDRDYLFATDWVQLKDGSLSPVRHRHYPKNTTVMVIAEEGPIPFR